MSKRTLWLGIALLFALPLTVITGLLLAPPQNIVAKPAAELTLVSPKSGDFWEAATQETIIWGYTGSIAGNVRLEYSTNGKQSWKTILDAIPVTQANYAWVVPDDPSEDAFVRVVSTMDSAISDTNNLPFTLFTVLSFEDSRAWAQPGAVQGGDAVTLTAIVYEESAATMLVTATLPDSLTYVTDTVRVDPAWKRAPEMTAGELFWWDTVTRTIPVRISFQAQVTTTTSTLGLTTLFFATREGETRLELPATVIVNGLDVFLPVVLK